MTIQSKLDTDVFFSTYHGDEVSHTFRFTFCRCLLVATITREVDIGQAQVFSSPSLTPAYASHKLSFARFFYQKSNVFLNPSPEVSVM